jgi:hypothetical protein
LVAPCTMAGTATGTGAGTLALIRYRLSMGRWMIVPGRNLCEPARIAISTHAPVLSSVEARHWRTHPPFDELRAGRLLLPRIPERFQCERRRGSPCRSDPGADANREGSLVRIVSRVTP